MGKRRATDISTNNDSALTDGEDGDSFSVYQSSSKIACKSRNSSGQHQGFTSCSSTPANSFMESTQVNVFPENSEDAHSDSLADSHSQDETDGGRIGSNADCENPKTVVPDVSDAINDDSSNDIENGNSVVGDTDQDEELTDHEQSDEDERGARSPSTSSLSSTCSKVLNEIYDEHGVPTETDTQRAMRDPKLVLPVEARNLLQELTQDPSFKHRFKSLIKHDVRSFLLSSGRRVDSPGAIQLLQQLSSGNDSLVLAQFGAAFIEAYMDFYRKSGEAGESQCKVETSEPMGDIDCENEQGVDSINHDCRFDESPKHVTVKESVGLPPPVPEYRPFTEESSGVVSNAIPSITTIRIDQMRGVAVEDRVWAAAYDHVDDKNPIKEMGEVLFPAVFSETEILNRRLKKGKDKHGVLHERFCPDKVRFINKGIAWLLKRPAVRTQAAFEELQEDVRLNATDKENMEKKVLTEFAYRQRKTMLETASRKSV